ncbi:MAG TPA: hypothetical protein VFG50_08005 [Rhodothermales bacterium]|nr:hypothetical protein [Rhodothermales bacterium]
MAEISIKQKIVRAVEDLPETATYEDAIERLVLLHKIERGLEESRAGLTVPQSEVEAEARAWRK